MRISAIFYRVLLAYFMSAAAIDASDQELLQSKDINKIMKQIFNQHVDKKEMTVSILKNSFKSIHRSV